MLDDITNRATYANPSKKRPDNRIVTFIKLAQDTMIDMPEFESQGNRPLQTTFEGHLKALAYFHLVEQHSAQYLLMGILIQNQFRCPESDYQTYIDLKFKKITGECKNVTGSYGKK